jgi:hypothetical protein
MIWTIRIVFLSAGLIFLSELAMEAQTAGFELDHFFAAVDGPEAAGEALESAGFLPGPSNTHPGQGTASRGILFENAYLELIWLSDAEEARGPAIRRTRLAERLILGGDACPFGIGLRGGGIGPVRLPFETWEYRPPYLPEELFFRMAESSEDLEEPLVFFLPWLSGPTWPPSDHPNRAKEVTGLEITLTGRAVDSPTVSALSRSGIASFIQGPDYFMDVELDRGRSGETLDLRPALPLRLRW